jgi:hypothetical protein
MSTRGLIAVTDGDDVLGVLHQYSSVPSYLGNTLLLQLLNARGDLRVAIRRWIRDAPGGWTDLRDAARGEDDPAFYRKEDLEDIGWIDWTYLFDEKARILRVWEGTPFDDDTIEPTWTVQLAADGRATPALFEQEHTAWHQIPVSTAWTDDTEEAHADRMAFGAGVRDRNAEAELARDVEAELARALDELEWDDPWEGSDAAAERDLRVALGMPSRPPLTAPSEPALCIAFDASDNPSYWEVRIGAHLLRFPVAACFRYEVSPLELHRADGRTATIDLAEVLPVELLRPLVEAAARMRSAGNWELTPDGLYLYRSVVADDGAIDAASLISVSAARAIDPSFDVGDTIGVQAPMPSLHWLVLEWIRDRQVAASAG